MFTCFVILASFCDLFHLYQLCKNKIATETQHFYLTIIYR